MKQKLLNKLWLRVGMIVAIMTTALSGTAWAETGTISIGFEGGTYADWTLTTIKDQQTNNNVSAHGGSYYGDTDGKTSGSVVSKEKIASPQNITFYISKESTNTTASSWLVKVSTDGSTWTTVGDAQSASSGITRGTWTEVTRDLSSYSNVYVGVFYDGTTAVRCIDDITVTYTTSGGSGGGGDTPSPTEGTGTITFGTGKTAINSASVTGDDDLGNTWTITTVGTTSFTANSAYYQVGSGNSPATSITFTTTLASELNITAMSAKFGGFSNTAGTVTLKVGDTTVGTGSLNGTSDVTVNSTSAATGTVLTVTVTGISRGVKCYYISYTCTSSTDPTCGTPTFSPAAGTYTSAQNVTISTETAGATIYYTTDGTDPTTSSTQYSGAINVSSTTTIKAIAAAEDHNNSPVASATYTIVPLEHTGTQADPYTIADAYTAIDANAGITGVYVSGIVCTAANSLTNNKYLSYYISDDGTTTKRLEAYHGLGIGGADFTSADDIQVGDKVVIYGNLTKYSSTYEFAADNQLVSIVRPPVINADSPVDLTYNATSGEIAYTIDNSTGATLTATTNADWISNITVGASSVTFTTTANEGDEQRSATITLSYTGATDKEVTVTQAAYVAPFETTTWTLASSITSGKHYIIVGMNDDDAYAMGEQKTNNRAGEESVTVSGTTATVSSAAVQEFVIYGPDADGLYTIYDGKGYLYAASSTANNLKTEAAVNDNARWEITFSEGVASIKATQSSNRNVMRFNYNNGSPLFACYATASQSAVSLYEKAGEATPTESKTLNASGYATYCSQNALDFTNATGGTAWAVTAISGTTITFEQVTGAVPAGTGLLLKSEANATTITIPCATGATALTSNLLIGTTADFTVANDGDYYGLSGQTFVKVNAGTVPAGKALLPKSAVEEGTNVKALTFVFDDEATGIKTIETVSAEEAAQIFNLAGQRINKMQKGINIVNGKKVLK